MSYEDVHKSIVRMSSDPPSRPIHPQNITKVREKLFLGSVQAASNVPGLQQLGITHVLTVGLELGDVCGRKLRQGERSVQSPPPLSRMLIGVEDEPEADLASHWEATTAFIEEGCEQGGVLVHCRAGRSRSAAVVAAYLLMKESLTVEKALADIRSVRRIEPNAGFVAQLGKLETALGVSCEQSSEGCERP